MVNNIKWTAIDCREIESHNYRLDASAYNVDARNAEYIVSISPWKKLPLIGNGGFVEHAHYGGRLKRKYIDKYNIDAIGFLGSSEMLQVNPLPEKFLSRNFPHISDLKVTKNTVLLSRSGTIGNLALVNKTLESFLISEHAIRLERASFPGYIYAFLKSDTGQLLIKSKVYGAVVDQIEPEQIAEIMVPDPSADIKKIINNKIIESYDLRDRSNDLIKEAEKILINELRLPPIPELSTVNFKNDVGFENYQIKAHELDSRFDASYHIPQIAAIEKLLTQNSTKVLQLGSKEISSAIILPGRFKRTYVDQNNGTVFLGGKQIYELDPCNKKYLSITKHESRIKRELYLQKNMIAITCSGSIGKVNIIPKHWENWTMSQHVLRIIPQSDEIAGYLYIWLNTEYAKILINRHIYGSVINEIDDTHIAQVSIPILSNKKNMQQINNLALEANELRSKAYYLEQEAIQLINKKVLLIDS